MNDTEEIVDLSELDLLDDGRRHARCTACQPGGLLVPFMALCGVRAMHRNHPVTGGQVAPPDACGECKTLWDQPCAVCGAL